MNVRNDMRSCAKKSAYPNPQDYHSTVYSPFQTDRANSAFVTLISSQCGMIAAAFLNSHSKNEVRSTPRR